MNSESGINAYRQVRRLISLLRSKSQHGRNVASQLLCRFVALGSFAAALPFFIARQGAADYGILALLLSVYSFLTLLDLGVSYSVGLRIGRSLARGDGRGAAIFARSLPLAIALGLLVSILILAVAPAFSSFLYGSDKETTAIRVFGAIVGIYIFSSTPAAVVQIHHRVDWFNYSKLVTDISKAAALVVGGLGVDPINEAVWVLLIGASVKCVIDVRMAALLLGNTRTFGIRLHRPDLRVNLGLGLPMSIAGIVNIAVTSGDRVLVSRMYGAEALAHYSLAVDICSKAYFLVWGITGTIYPIVVRKAAGRHDVSIYRWLGLLSVALIGALIYLPIGLFARPAINWWLGTEMASGASAATSIWAFVAVIYLMVTVLQNQLQAKGRPTALLGVNLTGIAILLAGSWLLPRACGIIGIAIMMGVLYLVQFCMLWIFDTATPGTEKRQANTVAFRGLVRRSES